MTAVDKLFDEVLMIATIFLNIWKIMESIFGYIKLRKNTRIELKTGHIIRNLSAISQRNDLQRWMDNLSYGKRWIVETVFSSIKKTFGEYVYSVKFENMVKEMGLKASLYNKIISI
jgi:hypothetical protein